MAIPRAKFTHFIGLDLSLAGSGMALFHRNGDLLRSGVSRTKPEPHAVLRYEKMSNQILDFIDFKKNNRPLICIEDYAFAGKGKVFQIGENGGIIKYRLWKEAHIAPRHIVLVTPQHLKIFATGKGNAKKDMVMKDVFKLWGFEGQDDNEVDAFVLGKIAHHLGSGDSAGLNAKQKEVLKKITQGMLK